MRRRTALLGGLTTAATFAGMRPRAASAAGPPTVRQVSASVANGTVGTSGTITPTLPAAALAGSVVFAFILNQSATNTSPFITIPSGWFAASTPYLYSGAAFSPELRGVYWTTGFTGSSQAFTCGASSGVYLAATMIEFAGANTTSPVDSGSGFGTYLEYFAGGTYNGPNNAPSQANTYALASFWTEDQDVPWASPATSGWTSLIAGPGAGGFYANTCLLGYNSSPTSGVGLQAECNISAYNAPNTPDLTCYELFVAPASGTAPAPSPFPYPNLFEPA